MSKSTGISRSSNASRARRTAWRRPSSAFHRDCRRFVTVKVPFAYRLPAGTPEPDCVQVRDHTVVHGSFMETADAEAWAIGYVEGLKPCPHPKGGRQ